MKIQILVFYLQENDFENTFQNNVRKIEMAGLVKPWVKRSEFGGGEHEDPLQSDHKL